MIESGPKGGPEVFFCSRSAAFAPKGSPQMAQTLMKLEEMVYSGPKGDPGVFFFVQVILFCSNKKNKITNTIKGFH